MIQSHPDPSCSLTPAEAPTGRISPLFWQHGEDPDVLREELRAMRSVGIRQCIIASRPHPDWLGPGWWESLEAILDEAETLGMRIWLLGDSSFPSGRDGALIRDRHPELLKACLACRTVEARGPLASAAFRVGARVAEGEALVGAVAARKRDTRGPAMAAASLVDLGGRVEKGLLRWDVPEGAWRLFRGGIGKLASSAAHLDPRKAGNTMCELFGAYVWQLGLGGMKWITDHACVRGVNFLVPHAFSPKFPDPDCPPRFYARGQNPQWRLFVHWAGYAERLCHLLSGGEHCAPAAVLYHAEAEWSGDSQPFQEPVRALAEAQIDCDVVCMDTLLDPLLTRIGAGFFTVNRESFHCMVVPRAQRLPLRMLELLARLQRAGVRVIFSGEAPTGASDGEPAPGSLALLRAHPMAGVVPLEGLAEALRSRGLPGLRAAPEQPHLRTYRYRRRGMDLVFCWNEDPRANVDTRLVIDETRSPLGYDALADAVVSLAWERCGGEASVRLRLEPYQSLFIAFPDDASVFAARGETLPFIGDMEAAAALEGPWRVATTESPDPESFTPRTDLTRAGDLSQAPGLEGFSGTASYETELVVADAAAGGLWLDLGTVGDSSEAWIDGRKLGTRICPPHRYALGGVAAGTHTLRVEVTTTLARRCGGDASDRAMAQEPTGLVGPVRLMLMK